jgi:hypothetical protein
VVERDQNSGNLLNRRWRTIVDGIRNKFNFAFFHAMKNKIGVLVSKYSLVLLFLLSLAYLAYLTGTIFTNLDPQHHQDISKAKKDADDLIDGLRNRLECLEQTVFHQISQATDSTDLQAKLKAATYHGSSFTSIEPIVKFDPDYFGQLESSLIDTEDKTRKFDVLCPKPPERYDISDEDEENTDPKPRKWISLESKHVEKSTNVTTKKLLYEYHNLSDKDEAPVLSVELPLNSIIESLYQGTTPAIYHIIIDKKAKDKEEMIMFHPNADYVGWEMRDLIVFDDIFSLLSNYEPEQPIQLLSNCEPEQLIQLLSNCEPEPIQLLSKVETGQSLLVDLTEMEHGDIEGKGSWKIATITELSLLGDRVTKDYRTYNRLILAAIFSIAYWRFSY